MGFDFKYTSHLINSIRNLYSIDSANTEKDYEKRLDKIKQVLTHANDVKNSSSNWFIRKWTSLSSIAAAKEYRAALKAYRSFINTLGKASETDAGKVNHFLNQNIYKMIEVENIISSNTKGHQDTNLKPFKAKKVVNGKGIISVSASPYHPQITQDLVSIHRDTKSKAVVFMALDGISHGANSTIDPITRVGSSGSLVGLFHETFKEHYQDVRELTAKLKALAGQNPSHQFGADLGEFLSPVLSKMAEKSESIPFFSRYTDNEPPNEATTVSIGIFDEKDSVFYGMLLGDSGFFIVKPPEQDGDPFNTALYIGANTGSMSDTGGYIENGLPGVETDWRIETKNDTSPQVIAVPIKKGSLIFSVTDGTTDNLISDDVLQTIIRGSGFDEVPILTYQDTDIFGVNFTEKEKDSGVYLPKNEYVLTVATKGAKSTLETTIPSAEIAHKRLNNYLDWLEALDHKRDSPPSDRNGIGKPDDRATGTYTT